MIDTEKPIRFPEVNTFSGLFAGGIPGRSGMSAALGVVEGPLYEKFHNRRGRDRATISRHCMVSLRNGRKKFISITGLAPGVFTRMQQFIMPIDDSMFFEIIEWEDGKALVTISHNRIIGSHWLAVIDFATVPLPPDDPD